MNDARPRYANGVKIAGVLVIMALAVWFTGERLREGMADREHAAAWPWHARIVPTEIPPRPQRATPDDVAAAYGDGGQGQARTMNAYYARRAYHGAPPVIPHPVDRAIADEQDCNVCHAKGGFAAKFNAYTPVTPHPEFANCLQCHVEQTGVGEFRANDWVSVAPPKLHRAALPGGPPPMAHGVHMRDNCLSCHAGPAAPLEIRTKHPERVHCMQCHVPHETLGHFERPQPGATEDPRPVEGPE